VVPGAASINVQESTEVLTRPADHRDKRSPEVESPIVIVGVRHDFTSATFSGLVSLFFVQSSAAVGNHSRSLAVSMLVRACVFQLIL